MKTCEGILSATCRTLAQKLFVEIITVINGRPERVGEAAATAADLSDYLTTQDSAAAAIPAFYDSLSGHLAEDPASETRWPIILKFLMRIAEPDHRY